MSILKWFSPKDPQSLEQEGDTYAGEGLWGNAKVAYERALSRLEKKGEADGESVSRIQDKIGRTRELLAMEHMEGAAELITGGYHGEACDLLRLALELTRDADLEKDLLKMLAESEGHLKAQTELPDALEGVDEDGFHEGIADEDEHFFALCSALPDEIQMAYLGYGPNFKSGYLALNAGDFEAASHYLSLAQEENGSYDTYIPLELATAYLNLGEGEKAAQLLLPFLNSHPDALPAYQLMCDILWDKGAYGQAADLLASVPEDLQESLAVVLLKGETFFQAGEFQKARSFFKGFMGSYGYNEEIARALASTHEALGEMDEALGIYQEIMDSCRSCHARIDPKIKEKFADLSFDSGHRDTHILELYLSLAQEIPGRARVHYRKVSSIYTDQGNQKEAARFRSFSEELAQRAGKNA